MRNFVQTHNNPRVNPMLPERLEPHETARLLQRCWPWPELRRSEPGEPNIDRCSRCGGRIIDEIGPAICPNCGLTTVQA
jgi:rubrerythrin